MQGKVTAIAYDGELVQSIDLHFPRSVPPLDLHVTTLERIGQGSFGTVYRATSAHSRYKNFALKIASGKPGRLQQEIQVMNKVCTKGRIHLVRMDFVAINESESLIALGLELCLPLTLHDFLVSYRLTSELDMLYLAYQVVQAVVGVHDEDCVHRDIKLQNFVFDLDCNVKLIDFGLAYGSITPPPGDLVAGTVSFMAPEMASNALSKSNRVSVGAPADVWSVGIVLFSIVTQRNPYPPQPTADGADGGGAAPPAKPEDNQSLLRRVSKGQWVWPTGLTLVSRDFRELIESMLSLVPAQRPTLRQVLVRSLWSIRRRSPPKALESFLGLEQFETLLAASPEQQEHLLRNVERKSLIVNASRCGSVANTTANDEEGEGTDTGAAAAVPPPSETELDVSASQRVMGHGRRLEKEFRVVLDEACKPKSRARSKSKSLILARDTATDVSMEGASLPRPAAVSSGRSAPRQGRSNSKSIALLDATDDLPVPCGPRVAEGNGESAPTPRAASATIAVAEDATNEATQGQQCRSRSKSLVRGANAALPAAVTVAAPSPPPPTQGDATSSGRVVSSSRRSESTGAMVPSEVAAVRKTRSLSRQASERGSTDRPTLDALEVTAEVTEASAAVPAGMLRRGRPPSMKRVPVVTIETPSSKSAAAAMALSAHDESTEPQRPLHANADEDADDAPPIEAQRLLGTLSTQLATAERKCRTAVARLVQAQHAAYLQYLWILIEEDQAWYAMSWLAEAQAKHANHPHRFKVKEDLSGQGYNEGFVCDMCDKEFAPPPAKRGAALRFYHCTCGMDICMQCFSAFEAACRCKACKKGFPNGPAFRLHACQAKQTSKTGRSTAKDAVEDEVPSGKRRRVEGPATSKRAATPEPSSRGKATKGKAAASPPKHTKKLEVVKAIPAKEKKKLHDAGPVAAPRAAKKAATLPAKSTAVVQASPAKAASRNAVKTDSTAVEPTKKGTANEPKDPASKFQAQVSRPNSAIASGPWKPDFTKVATKAKVPPATAEERGTMLSHEWIRYFHFTTHEQPASQQGSGRRGGGGAATADTQDAPEAFVYHIQPGRTGSIFLDGDTAVHSMVYSAVEHCVLVVQHIDPSAAAMDVVGVVTAMDAKASLPDGFATVEGAHATDHALMRQRRAPGTMSVYQPPASSVRSQREPFLYIRWFRIDEALGVSAFLLSTGGVQVFIGNDVELRWKDPARRFLIRSNGVCEAVTRETFPKMDVIEHLMSETIDDA